MYFNCGYNYYSICLVGEWGIIMIGVSLFSSHLSRTLFLIGSCCVSVLIFQFCLE